MYNVQLLRKVTSCPSTNPPETTIKQKTDRIKDSARYVPFLILFLVKKEILFARIVRPNILYTFIDFAFIFHLL